MTPAQGLPKTKRVAKRREYLRTYETGQKLFSRYAVLFVAPNELPHSRIGITATRKLGKAHVRNRLKRWTREIYRSLEDAAAVDERCLDIVINVKPVAATATFQQYRDDLSRVLGRLSNPARP